MYAYFNSNKELAEIISDNLTAGSSSSNVIYAYWDSSTFTDGAIVNVTIKYKRIGGESLSTEYVGTLEEGIQVPPSEDRDYQYFEEYTDYKMAKFEIPNAVLAQEGSWIATIRMATKNGAIIYSMNDLTFMVKGSYVYDSTITESEYNYITNGFVKKESNAIQVILRTDTGDTPISLKSGVKTGAFLRYEGSDGTVFGYLGANSENKPTFYDKTATYVLAYAKDLTDGLALKLDKAGGEITGNLKVDGALEANSEKVDGTFEANGVANFNSSVNANNDLEVGGELLIDGIDKLTNKNGSQLIIANPSDASTATISKIKVGDTIYGIQGEGGTIVEANPTDDATLGLSKLKIGETIYDFRSKVGLSSDSYQIISVAQGNFPLVVKSGTESISYIGFYNSENNPLGFIGVNSSNLPYFYDGSNSYEMALKKDVGTKLYKHVVKVTNSAGYIRYLIFTSTRSKTMKSYGLYDLYENMIGSGDVSSSITSDIIFQSSLASNSRDPRIVVSFSPHYDDTEYIDYLTIYFYVASTWSSFVITDMTDDTVTEL